MLKRLKRKTGAPDKKWDWEELRSRRSAANAGTDRTPEPGA